VIRVIVAAGIVATAILIAAAAMIYFSPYQTCVRIATGSKQYTDSVPLTERGAQIVCYRARGN
jgi:hypothetical protein